MASQIPAVVVAEKGGAVLSQNQPARSMMGAGTGKNCWDVFRDMDCAEGLPCRPHCVGELIDTGMDRAQLTRVKVDGRRHSLTCIPVDGMVICMLNMEATELPETWQNLTAREQQVLQLLADGATTGDAAKALGVSESTLRTHVEKMRDKLGVTTRAALVALGYRLGYLG